MEGGDTDEKRTQTLQTSKYLIKDNLTHKVMHVRNPNLSIPPSSLLILEVKSATVCAYGRSTKSHVSPRDGSGMAITG